MDMSRPPAVNSVAERIGAGFDGTKEIVAVLVGQHTAAAAEVGVDGSDVGVVPMTVASAGIGLPDFDKSIADRASIAVEDITMNNGLFADRLAGFGVVKDEIVVERPKLLGRERRAGHFR